MKMNSICKFIVSFGTRRFILIKYGWMVFIWERLQEVKNIVNQK